MNKPIIFSQSDFDWLCEEATVKSDSQMRLAMQRRHVDGDTDEAIAAELGITVSGVRSHISQGWRKIRAYLQRPTRIEDLHRTIREARVARQERRDTYTQQGQRLLQAMQGPRRPDPQAPVLDDVFRKVGNHDPLVDKHEAAEIIREAQARRQANT